MRNEEFELSDDALENVLGRVDKTARLLKEQVDNLLKIYAEISRNI